LACKTLAKKCTSSIREVAKVIGLIVASFSAVEYGKLHYRQLEQAKSRALSVNKGNFDAFMTITMEMRTELHWWIEHVDTQIRQISRKPISVEIFTDASALGWGAKMGDCQIGGRWSCEEASYHINTLEMLAIFHALRALKDNVCGRHVKIYSDNSTAVAYINNMGGVKSSSCNNVSGDIWEFCIENDIWLTCAHIAGSSNTDADRASRNFNDKHEWQLDSSIFGHICEHWGVPDIDLFASRLNRQLQKFCSWRPDPDSAIVDAFTVSWNNLGNVYIFPPFSLMGRCLQKIREEKARGIVLAPLWITQPWFPRLMELLVDNPVIIRKKKGLLVHPTLKVRHPLEDKLKIVVCKVSGEPLENEAFRKRLPTSLCHLGNQAPKSSTVHSLTDGFHTVVKNKLISFQHLWKK